MCITVQLMYFNPRYVDAVCHICYVLRRRVGKLWQCNVKQFYGLRVRMRLTVFLSDIIVTFHALDVVFAYNIAVITFFFTLRLPKGWWGWIFITLKETELILPKWKIASSNRGDLTRLLLLPFLLIKLCNCKAEFLTIFSILLLDKIIFNQLFLC